MNKMLSTDLSRPRGTRKPLFAALLAACVPLAAQAADPVPPGAGSILQQVQPAMPPTPSPSGTGLTIEREGGASLPSSAPFLVQSIRIVGTTLFETATLHALVADAEGKSRTLSQLDELATRITSYYHRHGYPLARAVIPAQIIRDGVVRLVIVEARYGRISADNQSRVNAALLQATLAPLQSGQAIGQAGLDHALLLLSDIPGVVVNATLKPGEAVGTSDLLVDITPGVTVSGSIVLDNHGNRFTGRARVGGTLNVINPLHHGDVLTLNGLGSGRGTRYGRIAYESLLNGRGTRLGGAYSALHYSLGEPLAALAAHGTARVRSVWAKHPLVRARDFNLYGQIQYDRLQLRDRIDASANRTDRHLDQSTASLAGDARDEFLSAGVNAWNAGWTAGRVRFDDAAARLADADGAGTQGRFSKWNASLARLQSLGPANGLYLAFSGQWSNANLDPSQKMTAGGPYTVRAYDTGAVSGDTGYLATIEFRHSLGRHWEGHWEAVAFADSSHVKVNRIVRMAGANSATLSGAGVGLNWSGPDQWIARAFMARRVGSMPVLVANSASVRGWVEIRKGF